VANVRRTIDVTVDACHACMKTVKKVILRKCDKCVIKVECITRPVPICTNICNKCWTAHVRVAGVLRYKGMRDGWGES
jgi:hypothetical protein